MSTAGTLLTTKLHRPHVTRDLVACPRLWSLLDRGLDGHIVVVAAGAGYGKTTLVSSWLESPANGYGDSGASITGLPAAWLSLDEFDSDLNVFVRYFVAALRTIWPDACPDTLALLQAPQQPPLAALIATLSNEIELLPNDFVLVLDDFHSISGEQVPDLLAGLSRHWPRLLHLVLITRHNRLKAGSPACTLQLCGWIVEPKLPR